MLRWLPWKRGPNYEYELPRLAVQIRELKLKELAATNANLRWPTQFVQHSLSVYILYVAYTLLLASNKRFHVVLLAILPVLIVLGYMGISRATRFRKNRIQSALRLVEEQRKTLVASYKKQVKFDEIMNLIGEEQKAQQIKAKTEKNAKSEKSTRTAKGPTETSTKKDTTEFRGSSAELGFDGPIPVYQTSWMDRILDVIIGVNENSPAFRYALICPHCRAHNGLAPYGKSAEETTYFCRVCGKLVNGGRDSGVDPQTIELVKKSLDKEAGVDKQKQTDVHFGESQDVTQPVSDESENLESAVDEAERKASKQGRATPDEESLIEEASQERLSSKRKPEESDLIKDDSSKENTGDEALNSRGSEAKESKE